MKKRLSKLLPLLYVIIFLYSAYVLVQYLYTYYEASMTLKETQEMYEIALENVDDVYTSEDYSEENNIAELTMRPQFADLHAVNERIVGWVSIDGEKLNNPILQAEDNDFYLNRNFKDGHSRAGSVFMDYRNDVENPGRNTIIYGHAMKNGTMFGDLKKYLNQDYADNNATIFFDSLYEGYDIEVFAAYETTIDFYYIETEFPSDSAFMDFIEEVEEHSVIEMPTTIGPDDRILTLSTCNNSVESKDKRFVVQGKLVKRN